jgi:hypothetical protein
MGWAATSTMPKGTPASRAVELLQLLGFTKLPNTDSETKDCVGRLLFFDDDEPRHASGVRASVYRSKERRVSVQFYTNTWCSKADSDAFNGAVRTLRRMLGGHYISDEGPNTPIPDGEEREPAQAGCFWAYTGCSRSLSRGHLLRKEMVLPERFETSAGHPQIDDMNPRLLANNLQSIYLVTCLEEYLGNTFFWLLRFSKEKAGVFKQLQIRLSPEELASVADRTSSLEEVVAGKLSFQNLRKADESFRSLDKRLDVGGTLKKTRSGRKSPWKRLGELIERRHRVVHRGDMDLDYSAQKVGRDYRLVQRSVNAVYRHITSSFGWPCERD